MINFRDSFNVTRAIEFSLSYDGRYVNMTTYNDKQTTGHAIQIPIEAFKELRLEICNLKTGDSNECK